MALVTTLALLAAGPFGSAFAAAVFADTDPARTEEELANRMPGLPAFVVFGLLAVVLYFLLRNMNARLRRMSYAEREREERDAAAVAEADETADGVETADGDSAGGDAAEAASGESGDAAADGGESEPPHTDPR